MFQSGMIGYLDTEMTVRKEKVFILTYVKKQGAQHAMQGRREKHQRCSWAGGTGRSLYCGFHGKE